MVGNRILNLNRGLGRLSQRAILSQSSQLLRGGQTTLISSYAPTNLSSTFRTVFTLVKTPRARLESLNCARSRFAPEPTLIPLRTYYGRSRYHSSKNTGFLDRLSPDNLIYTILGINVGVFLLIQLAYFDSNQKKVEQAKLAVRTYLAYSNYNLKSGRWWTLLTSNFTHQGFWHLFGNCFSLYFFGPTVAAVLGARKFLTFFLVSGVISSGGFGLVNKLSDSSQTYPGTNITRNDLQGTIGASGQVMAILSYFALKFPHNTIYLYFFPVPAYVAVSGLILYDLYRTRNPASRFGVNVNHTGHLMGALSGLVYFLATRRPPPNVGGRYRMRS